MHCQYRVVAIVILLCFFLTGKAQFNTDRLMTTGKIALHYEDYALSIQYFSQIITAKPHLYEPWYMRSVAKFYLDDYSGAEQDATEALRLNPYVSELYDLRGIVRIRQKDFSKAIVDYTAAIGLNPDNKNYWYNRAVCRMENKEYDKAHLELDTIIGKWKTFSNAYNVKAEVYIHQKDTLAATECLDKSIEIDPYNADAWMTRASISMNRKEWKNADRKSVV